MVLFARLDSKNYTCFTPLVEHTAQYMCDLVQYMRANGYKSYQINPLPADKRPTKKYFPLSSGYFVRNPHKCFKSVPEEAASLGGVKNILFGYTFDPSDFTFAR
jgi:hypothetical protein